ncbi:protein SMAX1-LIKE 6-like [Juglans microcarpa x Juglans regia]|uniref:protein SMAX1-LIKE 6-like n=1 Tax=Juglans microcarpa x Juglans regia TaxID=2249226 RepID=UPI001B7EF469|nr:protein SMAX1-LIKE 6-like [Juglans microcarpa x Juglans regia]
MPTPVSAARQCLTEEAARVLDDAVAVARRRSHAQTTSLHAISALLALPSSVLRDACARARSGAYSPRLQFRALELSVGVSLDRLPSSSKALEEPPVSNSLMAAIKRSQANQRRHPESCHLHHQIIQGQQQTTSLLKVELKHFILSILDDPIVSRVLGEAGFRSCDIKIAIIHPPVSRFSRTRFPPVFLCNLTDSDPVQRSFSLEVSGDENSRRIAQVLLKKTGKNPLLVGACAIDALRSFTECINKGKGSSLPAELAGLSVSSAENDISEFVNGRGSEDKLGLKFKELGSAAKQCSGPGIVVNFGDLKALIEDSVSGAAVSFVVSQLTRLLELHGEKLWLMGAAGTNETYLKLLGRFPSIQKDWDLHPLPITSLPFNDGFCSKSSLMGSFVPFGGFFSTTSDFRIPLSRTNQSFARCKLCTEKYEREAALIQKGGSTSSVADQYSENLPSWLRMAELDAEKVVDVAKTTDDPATLNAKILQLQKKWNDICWRIHQVPPPKLDISHARFQVPSAEDFLLNTNRKEGSSKDSSVIKSRYANPSSSMPTDFQKVFPFEQDIQIPVASAAENHNFQSELLDKVSKSQQIEMKSPWFARYPTPNLSLPPDRASSSPVTSVTTDLGLGTLYASVSQEPDSSKISGDKECLQNLSGSVSAEVDAVSENTSHQVARSSSCSGPNMGDQSDLRDFKSLRRFLAEKVCWQDEAICSVGKAISCCRSGNGRHRGSSLRGDIWLTFLGPDKVGKKRIASALAELMFGTKESLISVDLGFQDRVYQSNMIFEHHEFECSGMNFRGKTVIDYIAGELRKKPHSVVFLQNVDKADNLAQRSLSQAIRTGKFADSYGREISINNMIFVIASMITKGDRTFLSSKEPKEFPEEIILKARRYQMQILMECIAGDSDRSNGMNVRVTPRKGTLNPKSVNKRRLTETCDSMVQGEIFEMPKRPHKLSRSYLDLNQPVDDLEDIDYGDCDSDSISENSEAWLEELFDQVDENVDFKSFNFDALAGKIVKDISLKFQRSIGTKVVLEIDYEVMVQMLAAAWLSDRNRAVEEWVEQVLCRSLAEARQKYHLTAQSVLKLVTCEGTFVEGQAPGACLPARINLN